MQCNGLEYKKPADVDACEMISRYDPCAIQPTNRHGLTKRKIGLFLGLGRVAQLAEQLTFNQIWLARCLVIICCAALEFVAVSGG